MTFGFGILIAGLILIGGLGITNALAATRKRAKKPGFPQ